MPWRSHPLPPVPDATAVAGNAAVPTGHLSVDLRNACGVLSGHDRCADLSADRGHPVAVAPWRLAVATVMHSIAGRTDRQTAAAVRRGMDGQDVLRVELIDPGFDCTLRHACRQRVRMQDGAPRMPDTVRNSCQARGWSTSRGKHRTESPSVLAAIRRQYARVRAPMRVERSSTGGVSTRAPCVS